MLKQDDQVADAKAVSLNVLKRESYPTEEKYLCSLIEHLDSPEVVLRMVAITRLKDATGKTFGYRFDSSIRERNEAVRKWTVWLSSKEWSSGVVEQNQDKDEIDA